ncbi:uncharacterized protein SOCE26_080730 [Sorangium cellulosum]|uniref:DUF6895 domain-containing protein n=1 Tax=Sorangium cellulosum TaxID=56 RepID=A0A2L0F4W0_SORCE|nr:hypothetical protein [Sorangium cellulosum]AUX46567.1 uncharacterized protein SOCE26_080730 [Sorangium cellulosum]
MIEAVEQRPIRAEDGASGLVRGAELGLSWVTRHLDAFIPWEDDQVSLASLKRLGDLSFPCSYLHAWQTSASCARLPLAQHLPRWEALLLRCCEDSRFLDAALADPEEGLYRMQLYGWLRVMGYRSARCEDVMRQLWRRGCTPRSVGALHCLWKAGYVRREPDWAALCREHVLSREACVDSLDVKTTYRVTHALFYATDFGNQALPLPKGEADRVAGVVERLLHRYHLRGKWDVVGELLINLVCLGRHGSALYDRALRAFTGARLPGGAIPMNRDFEQEFHAAEGRMPDSEVFRWCHHPTLVELVHCAAALRTW